MLTRISAAKRLRDAAERAARAAGADEVTLAALALATSASHGGPPSYAPSAQKNHPA